MKRIVEINGVKLEVDLTEAKTIDTYKVGDIVKLLVPKYGDDFTSCCGVIIGFDNFTQRPTIVVAYLEAEYSKAEIKIAYIHGGSKSELTHASPGDVPFSRRRVEQSLDKDIAEKQKALDEANWRKDKFETWFGAYFSDMKPAEQPA